MDGARRSADDTDFHCAVQDGDIVAARRMIAAVLVSRGTDPTIPGLMQLTAPDRAAERQLPEGRLAFAFLQHTAASGDRHGRGRAAISDLYSAQISRMASP
jgi:hypothetical protein